MDNLTKAIETQIAEDAKKANATDADFMRLCIDKNPFAKETWSVTNQCELAERCPELAKVLEYHALRGTNLPEEEIAAIHADFCKILERGGNPKESNVVKTLSAKYGEKPQYANPFMRII